MVKIGNASIDENGNIAGGKSGDQTGREVLIRDWYAHGWNYMLRAKSIEVEEKIAEAMEKACKNDLIGYDQNQRTSLYFAAKSVGFDLAKVEVACETDCSALVAVCVNAAGIPVSKDIYTGNEVKALLGTGCFDAYTAAKYLTSDKYLKRGDILVKEYSHTAVVLENGEFEQEEEKPVVKPATNFSRALAGKYKATTSLNQRTGAGKENPIIQVVADGDTVRNYGYFSKCGETDWLFVVYKGQEGYCSSKYLEKV